MVDELRQHAAFKCRVLKPLDVEWQYLSDALHGMTREIPQAMTTVVRRLYIEYSGDVPVPSKGDKALAQQTRAYQLTAAALPDWIPSHVSLGLAGVAYAQFKKWRKSQQTMQLPTFKRGHPIVWASGGSWSVSRDGRGIVLNAPVAGSKAIGGARRATLALEPCGPGDWGHVRRLLDGGGSKLGELRLSFDERRGSWTATIGYSWPKTSAADGEHVMALRRGVATFLTAVTSDGAAIELDDGVQLRSYKTQVSVRRSGLNRFVRRAIGSGARGHGKRRRLAVLEKLDNAERDWVDTRCKQLGSRVAKLALARGVRLVLLEKDTPRAFDAESKVLLGEKVAWFVERFPFYRLNMAIAGACSRVGVATEEVATAYDAVTCPACGGQEPEPGTREKGRYKCSLCGFSDRIDIASAFNRLIKSGHGDDVRAILQRRTKMTNEVKRAVKEEKRDVKQAKQDRQLRGPRKRSQAAA